MPSAGLTEPEAVLYMPPLPELGTVAVKLLPPPEAYSVPSASPNSRVVVPWPLPPLELGVPLLPSVPPASLAYALEPQPPPPEPPSPPLVILVLLFPETERLPPAADAENADDVPPLLALVTFAPAAPTTMG